MMSIQQLWDDVVAIDQGAFPIWRFLCGAFYTRRSILHLCEGDIIPWRRVFVQRSSSAKWLRRQSRLEEIASPKCYANFFFLYLRAIRDCCQHIKASLLETWNIMKIKMNYMNVVSHLFKVTIWKSFQSRDEMRCLYFLEQRSEAPLKCSIWNFQLRPLRRRFSHHSWILSQKVILLAEYDFETNEVPIYESLSLKDGHTWW